MPRTLKDLKEATNRFFLRHWNRDKLRVPPPSWSEAYFFIGPVPNHDRQGVYAFVSNNEVVDIGAAAARGSGKYVGAGLGARLHRYLRVEKGGQSIEDAKRRYRLVDKWKEIEYIVTIGFDRKYSYLAYALETFLIGQLSPRLNKHRPGQ